MNKDFILILGPQGSGKTTQARKLARFLGYKFISSGRTLRKLSTEKNPIGLKLSEYWIKGELVPDELMESVLFPMIEKKNAKGLVIDGYPRDVAQLKSFLSFLDLNQWAISHVFYLHVGEEESLKRLVDRREKEQRADESSEAIAKRFQLYHQETEPLLEEYTKMHRLTKIDGERTIEEIQEDLRSRFK